MARTKQPIADQPKKPKEMFKPYVEADVPDSMPFPGVSRVAIRKVCDIAIPNLNQNQRNWIHDVALRDVGLAAMTPQEYENFCTRVKDDAFTVKAFQHVPQAGDAADASQLPNLVATWKLEHPADVEAQQAKLGKERKGNAASNGDLDADADAVKDVCTSLQQSRLAEELTNDFRISRGGSGPGALVQFPVAPNDVDNLSPNDLSAKVKAFLIESHEAAFDTPDIQWADVCEHPDQYYDTAKFSVEFGDEGLRARVAELYAFAHELASAGSSGFFRKLPQSREEPPPPPKSFMPPPPKSPSSPPKSPSPPPKSPSPPPKSPSPPPKSPSPPPKSPSPPPKSLSPPPKSPSPPPKSPSPPPKSPSPPPKSPSPPPKPKPGRKKAAAAPGPPADEPAPGPVGRETRVKRKLAEEEARRTEEETRTNKRRKKQKRCGSGFANLSSAGLELNGGALEFTVLLRNYLYKTRLDKGTTRGKQTRKRKQVVEDESDGRVVETADSVAKNRGRRTTTTKKKTKSAAATTTSRRKRTYDDVNDSDGHQTDGSNKDAPPKRKCGKKTSDDVLIVDSDSHLD
ncbi:hypothetical protein C8F01DRAFT_1251761 [Mycena amicta]|nr:hypothetical protein C8F01DRAFT_1251761 [Mycena amicta]